MNKRLIITISVILILINGVSLVPVRAQQIVKAKDLNHLITKILQREKKENRIAPFRIKSWNLVRKKCLDSTISNSIFLSDTIWYMAQWSYIGGGCEEVFNAEYLFESRFHFDNIYAIDAYTDCFKHEARLTSDERMIRSWDREWIEKVKEHHVNDGQEIFAAMIIREKDGRYRYYNDLFTNYNEFLLCINRQQYYESEEYLRLIRRKYKRKRSIIIR